jgi:hypothetical protein
VDGREGAGRPRRHPPARSHSLALPDGAGPPDGEGSLLLAKLKRFLAKIIVDSKVTTTVILLLPWCWKVVVVEPYKSQTITCISPIRPILVLNRVMLGVHLYGVVAAMKDSWTHPIEVT